MAIEMRRTHLGAHPNEGARQAWLAMERLGLDQAGLRAKVKRELGKEMASGLLVKVLYCDRRPGVEWSEVFRAVLGVEPMAWYRSPEEPFEPPAARTDDDRAPDSPRGAA